jgi:hypothetical protein
MIEVLKQMYQLLLTEPHAPAVCDQLEVILRQAIAELESQDIVAWMYEDDYQRMLTSETFCTVYSVKVGSPDKGVTDVPLYTHPPQRTWVGLTNDELTDLFYNTNLGQASAVAQAIALLKEKNT